MRFARAALAAICALAVIKVVRWANERLGWSPDDDSTLDGTPSHVPLSVDCALRVFAYSFGLDLPLASAVPDRHAANLHDALQLSKCPKAPKRPVASNTAEWKPLDSARATTTASTLLLYVDPAHGHDSLYAGSRSNPLATVQEALRRANQASTSTVSIVLREGTYYVKPNDPLVVTRSYISLHSEPGEVAVITGAEPRTFKLSQWTRVSKDAAADVSVWSVNVPADDGGQVLALRMNNKRLVRAKTPNGAPELLGSHYRGASDAIGENGRYDFGWFDSQPGDWLPPITVVPDQAYESRPENWPFTHWPAGTTASASALDPFAPMAGVGGTGPFRVGHCKSGEAAYFCAPSPPRGEAYRFRAPSGLKRCSNVPKGAVVVAWRGGRSGLPAAQNATSRWFSWAWEVESVKDDTCHFGAGGHQGAQGADDGAEFYIENALAFLDEAGEFFHDVEAGKLYVAFNGSRSGPTGKESWGLVRDSRVLLRVQGRSADKPVVGFSLGGVVLRDAAASWLEPHYMPSGGDWGLPSEAAVVLSNVLKASISNCLFERLDGNGVLVRGYSRAFSLTGNEFAWMGASAVVLWGRTSSCLDSLCLSRLPGNSDGPDGRAGEQPRYSVISGNVFRELGVFVKQSSAVFQALGGFTRIEGNAAYNGPRALICFNDGFLGGDLVRNNLLFNAVRESGDHGPINAWSRLPFIHDVDESAGGSTRTLQRVVERNVILATYASQAALDTDDGASYLTSRRNVLAYGFVGLKSDFGGHDLTATDDVRVMLGGIAFVPTPGLVATRLALTLCNSTIILRGAGEHGYPSACAKEPGALRPVNVFGNKIYSEARLRACGGRYLDDVLERGWDAKTTVTRGLPSAADMVKMAKAALSGGGK